MNFFDLSSYSCLNSWLGGNVAGRPLDLVHFTHSAYAPADGTGGNSKSPMHWDTELLSAEAMSNATIFHEITDGWFGGKLGYGIGLEGSWNGTDALLPNICGLKYLGHGGQDYGSNMMASHKWERNEFSDVNCEELCCLSYVYVMYLNVIREAIFQI